MGQSIRPRFYKSEFQYFVLQVSMRRDKLGDLFYCIQYKDNDDVERIHYFSHLSSVLDFIDSNFKKS